MKWSSRLFLAAACASVHTVSALETSTEITETTLTESQCTATVKKVQASGKFTEDAILPICSSEVKSSKCDFFAEALSLASTHTDFTSKVFCKDMSEAHACSQMMDSLYQSVSVKDLLFGECMRSPEAKSETYCNKFQALLSRSVKESDLDTMRACYMMQAYDEKDGDMEQKPAPAKTEAKKEGTAKPAPKKEAKEVHAKASAKPDDVHAAAAHVAATNTTSQHANVSKQQKLVVKAHHEKNTHHVAKPAAHVVAAKNKSGSVAKPGTPTAKSAAVKANASAATAAKSPVHKANVTAAATSKSALIKAVAKHEEKSSHPKTNAVKAASTKASANKVVTKKEDRASKAHTNATVAKKGGNSTKAKTNASKVVALAKTNATFGAKTKAEQKAADEKKYGGFLSGFVL